MHTRNFVRQILTSGKILPTNEIKTIVCNIPTLYSVERVCNNIRVYDLRLFYYLPININRP